MFHSETIKIIRNLRIHELVFYVFLFLLPIQTRILYKPDSAYISWYFNYHLALFVYLTDLILVSCFIAWFIFDRPEIKTDRIFWLILAFFGLTLVSLFHVKHIGLGWYQVLKWLELLMLLFYIRETFKAKTQFLWAFSTIFICSTIQAAIALIQFHVQHSLGLGLLGEYIAPLGTSGLATIETSADKVIRAYGTFPHPNVLGAFLVLGLILGLYLAYNVQRTAYRIIVSLGIFIILLGIFVTFSRLAWVAAIISALAFLWFHVKHKNWPKTIVIIIILIVSCLTIFGLFHETLKARVLNANSTAVSDRGFFDHLGLTLVSRHPVFGIGVGNYVPALQDLFKLEAWQYQPAHNIFIFLAAELGILSLIIFIVILFLIFSRLKYTSDKTLKFSLITLGLVFLALGQFDHYFVTIQQGRLIFFTVLGLIAALPNLNAQKSD